MVKEFVKTITSNKSSIQNIRHIKLHHDFCNVDACPWMYSLFLEPSLQIALCFTSLFEATCHPPLRKWTNLTKPHQPGFGAILLQPHQADFGQPPKMRAQTFQKGGRKKKDVGAFFVFPISKWIPTCLLISPKKL